MNYEGINQSIGEEQIESLRLILENLHGETFSYQDVKEISETMLSFYELLARQPDNQFEVELL